MSACHVEALSDYILKPSIPKHGKLLVFGAGHVANALIPLLLLLECQIRCLDTRQVWLDKLPKSPKLSLTHTQDMASEVKHIDR